MKERKKGKSAITLLAHSKQVLTTFETQFMQFLVSWMTASTLVNVAAFPTVGFFTVNCNC
jgi:hypothetical protein